MANYNIEMNYYNGNSYDILQPKTILNNISDWQNNIYNKTEIDNKIQQETQNINSQIENINSKMEDYDNSFTLLQRISINKTVTRTKSSSLKNATYQLLPANSFYAYEDVLIKIKSGFSFRVQYTKNEDDNSRDYVRCAVCFDGAQTGSSISAYFGYFLYNSGVPYTDPAGDKDVTTSTTKDVFMYYTNRFPIANYVSSDNSTITYVFPRFYYNIDAGIDTINYNNDMSNSSIIQLNFGEYYQDRAYYSDFTFTIRGTCEIYKRTNYNYKDIILNNYLKFN